MPSGKLVTIVLSAFLAAAAVCIAVGLGLYFTAVGLPASADGRGARVLAGIVVLGVGCLNAAVSGIALAAVAVSRFLNKRNK